MKPTLIRYLFLVFLLGLWQASLAQTSAPTTTPETITFFAWLTKAQPDWPTGGLLALMGLIGALCTIFGFIGGAVPGTTGQAKIEKDNARLDRLTEILEDLIKNNSDKSEAITAVQKSVNSLRDDLRREHWRQFFIATLLYAFLGAMFATMLGNNFLQALVIGAGWTAIIGSLGLKKDYAEKKAVKDEASNQQAEVIKVLHDRLENNPDLTGKIANGGSRGFIEEESMVPNIHYSRSSDMELKKWIDNVNAKAAIANRL